MLIASRSLMTSLNSQRNWSEVRTVPPFIGIPVTHLALGIGLYRYHSVNTMDTSVLETGIDNFDTEPALFVVNMRAKNCLKL